VLPSYRAKTESCVFLAGRCRSRVTIGAAETCRTIGTCVPYLLNSITFIGDPAAVHYSIGNVGSEIDSTGTDLPAATGEAWDVVVNVIVGAAVGKVSFDVVGRVVR